MGIELVIMGAVRTTLTMEEFLALPELDAGKRELLRGELIELPPAKRKHNETAERFYEWLKVAIVAAGIGGKVHHEMGYDVSPRHWFQPDVSVTHPDQPGDDYYKGSPLLAVEIISPSNTADAIEAKIEDYLSHGGEEVWVVYPKQRDMWIYRKGVVGELRRGSFPIPLLKGQILDVDQILGE